MPTMHPLHSPRHQQITRDPRDPNQK
jgi:hypothetical protein